MLLPSQLASRVQSQASVGGDSAWPGPLPGPCSPRCPPIALLPCSACTAASYNPPHVRRTKFFKKGPEGGGVGDADWMLLDGGPLPPPLFQMLTSRSTPGRSLGNFSLRKLASLGEKPCQFCQPGLHDKIPGPPN